MNCRAKEEAKRHQELMENREKERREIRRQEVELIKEVYPSCVLSSYSSFNTFIHKFIQDKQMKCYWKHGIIKTFFCFCVSGSCRDIPITWNLEAPSNMYVNRNGSLKFRKYFSSKYAHKCVRGSFFVMIFSCSLHTDFTLYILILHLYVRKKSRERKKC